MNKGGQKNTFNSLDDLFRALKPHPAGNCLECDRALSGTGYPMISMSGKIWKVSRLIAHLSGWDIKGMDVMHTCDNRKCINPNHLQVVPHWKNMLDASEKGRMVRGEKHPFSKLKEEDVQLMRKLAREGEKDQPLAEKFGISESCVSSIVWGRSWAWLF